jgi:hypothetical protein
MFVSNPVMQLVARRERAGEEKVHLFDAGAESGECKLPVRFR